MERLYIKVINYDPRYNASKAMIDIDNILSSSDYAPLLEEARINQSKDFDRIFYKIKYLLKMRKKLKEHKDSILFVQYPTYLGNLFLFPLLFSGMGKRRKIVYIIHDLNGLRFHSKFVDNIDRKVLRKAYRIISHNSKMSLYIKDIYGIPESRIIDLNMFDYLVAKRPSSVRHKEDGLAFAGNVTKSYSLIKDYIDRKIKTPLHIYGYKGKDSPNIDTEFTSYEGIYPPEEIPNRLKGGFGLVWDGINVTDLTGEYGEYQRFNNPHKASLYLISNLPIICSDKAAIADYVVKENIGLAVSSLTEITKRIKELKEEEYQKMLDNVKKIGDNLSKGEMLKKALNKIE